MFDLRRQRIGHMDDSLPGMLGIVVLAGGALTIAVGCFFWIEDVRFHGLLRTMLSLFIALMVFLIAAFDHPFGGEVSISADLYRTIDEACKQDRVQVAGNIRSKEIQRAE